MASPSTSTSQFEPDTIDLGEVRSGQTVEAVFRRTTGTVPDAGIKDVMRVDVGCYCATTRIYPGEITVRYTAQPIARQVLKAPDFPGYQDILKWVTIVFTDQTFELVQLTARVLAEPS